MTVDAYDAVRLAFLAVTRERHPEKAWLLETADELDEEPEKVAA